MDKRKNVTMMVSVFLMSIMMSINTFASSALGGDAPTQNTMTGVVGTIDKVAKVMAVVTIVLVIAFYFIYKGRNKNN